MRIILAILLITCAGCCSPRKDDLLLMSLNNAQTTMNLQGMERSHGELMGELSRSEKVKK